MLLIVRLLATTPVPNDRIALTDRTKAYDDLVAVVGPAGSKLLQRDRHWDKEDRYLTRSPLLALIRQDAGRKRGPAS